MDEEEEVVSGDDLEYALVNAFQNDSESSDSDSNERISRKRKQPDDSEGDENMKIKSARKQERQLAQWADRSVSLMLNLRLQLYKVFEQGDENVEKRAWNKIASMLFPLSVTGEECLTMFNSVVEKYVSSWDPNFGAVPLNENDAEHFRFIEKLLRKSPKLRDVVDQCTSAVTFFNELGENLESDASRQSIAFLQSLKDDESVHAELYRHICKMRARQAERDRVFDEVLDDILKMQERKHILERALLRKFVFSEFHSRDEQMGFLAQILICLGSSESVPYGIIEKSRRGANHRADKRYSFFVLISTYSHSLSRLFDENDEENKLWLELLRDSHHFFIPQSEIVNHVILNEYGFKGVLRVDRTTVERVVEIFAACAPAKIGALKPLSVERVVLLSLWYLIHEETFHQLSIRFSIREADVRQGIITFISVLSDAADLIEWPESSNEVRTTVSGFENMRQTSFPGVIGALAAQLFHVRPPDLLSDAELASGDYLLEYDIAVQAVADSEHVFRSLTVKWVIEDELSLYLERQRKKRLGDDFNSHMRVPDPEQLFSRSALCNLLARKNSEWVEDNNQPFLPDQLHVLAGSSYPLLLSLMVPFNEKKPSPKEILFNKQWELSWSVVNKAFGKVINRFQRLNSLDYSLKNCADLIRVIFAIHNICMKEGDQYPAKKVELNDFSTYFPEATPKPEAIQKREKIMKGFVIEKIKYVYRGQLNIRSVPMSHVLGKAPLRTY